MCRFFCSRVCAMCKRGDGFSQKCKKNEVTTTTTTTTTTRYDRKKHISYRIRYRLFNMQINMKIRVGLLLLHQSR